MIRQIVVNGRRYFFYTQKDFVSILKPQADSKAITQDDIPEIIRLFDLEYEKYLWTIQQEKN